jgi:formate hydrogenlyase subunit 3/multisubunit Na+/H+ antiporter MnhD subunit
MSTPLIFIVFPILAAILVFVFEKKEKTVLISTICLCLFLGTFALLQDFGSVLKLGPLSLEIKTGEALFGRSFLLTNQDKFFLTIVYFLSALWFGAAKLTGVRLRFIAYGMVIIAILTAALAVEPFLYSAILVEIAVLFSIPMMSSPGKPAGKGIIRFLIFQSLAMPLILFGGWLLGGIQASPSDTGRLLQAALFLGIGFAFWLAVLPFQSWVPMLTEDTHPLISGFVLALFPVVTMLIMLDFISGLVWLRESQYLGPVLRMVGVIMVVSTGIWSITEKKITRLMGYAVLFQSGLSLVMVSLQSEIGVSTLMISFIPRLFAMALLSLSLSIIHKYLVIQSLNDLHGILRKMPITSIGLIFAFLSLAGFPLLSSFPSMVSLIEQLVTLDRITTIWIFVGIATFWFTSFRVIAVVTAPTQENWIAGENLMETIYLSVGISLLFLFGIAPNLINHIFLPLFQNLPVLR